MIVKIIDIHDNRFNMGGVESIRETIDGMISIKPVSGTVAIHVNGVELLQSERPLFDNRLIKSLEILV